MRSLPPALLAALLFALPILLLVRPEGARADAIEIEFDLTGSTISAVGGLINIPPDGTINAASMKLRVSGSGSLTPLPGPASIRSLGLDVTVFAPLLSATVTGFVMATQNGMAHGTLSALLGKFNLTDSLLVDASGLFDCTGALCGLFGTFPISINGTQTITPPFGLTLNGLSTLGGAVAAGALALSLASQTAVVNLAGVEVARTFIPEPSRVLQLAAAAALVAVLFARRGRGAVRS